MSGIYVKKFCVRILIACFHFKRNLFFTNYSVEWVKVGWFITRYCVWFMSVLSCSGRRQPSLTESGRNGQRHQINRQKDGWSRIWYTRLLIFIDHIWLTSASDYVCYHHITCLRLWLHKIILTPNDFVGWVWIFKDMGTTDVLQIIKYKPCHLHFNLMR